MNKIAVLCFDKDDNLVMGCINGEAENGDTLTYENKNYKVKNAQPKQRGMTITTRVVDFEEWKKKKGEK